MNIKAMHIKAFNWLLDFALEHHPCARNSNIVSYADEELRRAGWYADDAFYGDVMTTAVMRQARLFSIEGHSGTSASIASSITKKVCSFTPLMPLTGEDDEWNEVGEGVFQNSRMSSIFKENGEAYWLDGKVFREPSGVTYTNSESRVHVTFPFEPREPEVVDVPA